jgi:hypothetical protein
MTKPTYEVIPAEDYIPERVKRTDVDGKVWWIPVDKTNSDYQRYLADEAKIK